MTDTTDNIIAFPTPASTSTSTNTPCTGGSGYRYATESSVRMGRRPVFCVYVSERDRDSGIEGLLGRIALAEAVLNVVIDERIEAPLTFKEVASLDCGLGAVVLRALEGSFDVFVVTELASLGVDLSTAEQLCDLLGHQGIGIYVACHGWLTVDDLAGLWPREA